MGSTAVSGVWTPALRYTIDGSAGFMVGAEGSGRWALIAAWRRFQDAASLFSETVSGPRDSSRVFQTWSDALVWLRAQRPPSHNDIPWIGPSLARDELIRRAIAVQQ